MSPVAASPATVPACFGAHVVAFDPATGALIAAFTLNNNGEFQIAGLAPGPHVIRVEPLDDADVDSFFSRPSAIDVGFLVTFHDRLTWRQRVAREKRHRRREAQVKLLLAITMALATARCRRANDGIAARRSVGG